MLLIVIVSIAEMLANALAILGLWNWFVVPTFNMHGLTLVPAIGISLLINVAQYKATDDVVEQALHKGIGRTIFDSISMPLICLALGWIVSRFM